MAQMRQERVTNHLFVGGIIDISKNGASSLLVGQICKLFDKALLLQPSMLPVVAELRNHFSLYSPVASLQFGRRRSFGYELCDPFEIAGLEQVADLNLLTCCRFVYFENSHSAATAVADGS